MDKFNNNLMENRKSVSSIDPVIHNGDREQKIKKCYDRVEVIKNSLSNTFSKIDEFSCEIPNAKREYIYLDEMLLQSMIQIDDIDAEGDKEVRAAKRKVLLEIKQYSALLGEKNSTNVDVGGQCFNIPRDYAFTKPNDAASKYSTTYFADEETIRLNDLKLPDFDANYYLSESTITEIETNMTPPDDICDNSQNVKASEGDNPAKKISGDQESQSSDVPKIAVSPTTTDDSAINTVDNSDANNIANLSEGCETSETEKKSEIETNKPPPNDICDNSRNVKASEGDNPAKKISGNQESQSSNLSHFSNSFNSIYDEIKMLKNSVSVKEVKTTFEGLSLSSMNYTNSNYKHSIKENATGSKLKLKTFNNSKIGGKIQIKPKTNNVSTVEENHMDNNNLCLVNVKELANKFSLNEVKPIEHGQSKIHTKLRNTNNNTEIKNIPTTTTSNNITENFQKENEVYNQSQSKKIFESYQNDMSNIIEMNNYSVTQDNLDIFINPKKNEDTKIKDKKLYNPDVKRKKRFFQIKINEVILIESDELKMNRKLKNKKNSTEIINIPSNSISETSKVQREICDRSQSKEMIIGVQNDISEEINEHSDGNNYVNPQQTETQDKKLYKPDVNKKKQCFQSKINDAKAELTIININKAKKARTFDIK